MLSYCHYYGSGRDHLLDKLLQSSTPKLDANKIAEKDPEGDVARAYEIVHGKEHLGYITSIDEYRLPGVLDCEYNLLIRVPNNVREIECYAFYPCYWDWLYIRGWLRLPASVDTIQYSGSLKDFLIHRIAGVHIDVNNSDEKDFKHIKDFLPKACKVISNEEYNLLTQCMYEILHPEVARCMYNMFLNQVEIFNIITCYVIDPLEISAELQNGVGNGVSRIQEEGMLDRDGIAGSQFRSVLVGLGFISGPTLTN